MSSHKRISVLVADHDRWARLSVSSVLGEAGFGVEEASNGVSALRSVAVSPPHIVLIGGGLPEIATNDVVRALRADPRTRHTAVVHFRSVGGSAGLSDLDVDGHFELPCSPVELLATVVNALEARRSAVARIRAHEVGSTSSALGRVSATRQPVARSRK